MAIWTGAPVQVPAHIYCSNDTGGNTSFANSTCTVFNNVVDMSGSTNCAAAIWNAGRNAVFYNNTIIGPTTCKHGSSVGIAFGGGTQGTLQNNIFSTLRSVYEDPGPYGTVTSEIAASNYNIIYNCLDSSQCFAFGQGNWGSLSSWTSAEGYDANSTTSNPALSASYAPGSGSPAIKFGKNLDSLLGLTPCCSILSLIQADLGLGALAYDKALSARPISGNWDVGALQSSQTTVPAPSNLTTNIVPQS